MLKSKISYLGDLRCEATHLASGNLIVSDAPTDNHGKGEAFSPTDLASTSLALCMITVMGIKCNSLGIDLKCEAEVQKLMRSEPRRIGEIKVKLFFNGSVPKEHEAILRETALNCPVALSLHPKIKQEVEFIW
jgi:putative redox protein